MPDFNKLEQLNRLRESGALSNSEFEREKNRLFEADDREATRRVRNRKLILASLFIALVLVVALAAGLFGGRQNDEGALAESANSTATIDDVGDIAAMNTQAEPATLAVQPASPPLSATFAWAFSSEMIGLNPAFVESKLGPAKSKSKAQWEFEVEGCKISYGVKANEITSVSTFVKNGCLPKVDNTTITPLTTFSQLRGSYGTIRASCIYNCGNAYDRTIDLYQRGYHANNFIEVVYQSNYGDAEQAARDLWRQTIRADHGLDAGGYEGDDYEWYQCLSSAPPAVVNAIGSEHVGYVTIGRGLTISEGCTYKT